MYFLLTFFELRNYIRLYLNHHHIKSSPLFFDIKKKLINKMYSRIWDNFELHIYIYILCKFNIFASFCINSNILEGNLTANHYLNEVCFVYPTLWIKKLVISNYYLLPIDMSIVPSLEDIAGLTLTLGLLEVWSSWVFQKTNTEMWKLYLLSQRISGLNYS